MLVRKTKEQIKKEWFEKLAQEGKYLIYHTEEGEIVIVPTTKTKYDDIIALRKAFMDSILSSAKEKDCCLKFCLKYATRFTLMKRLKHDRKKASYEVEQEAD